MAPASAPLFVQDHLGAYVLARDEQVIGAALELVEGQLRRASTVMQSPEQVRQFFSLRLGHLPYEMFGVLFLDSQHAMIEFDEMFRGTLTQTSVYPREVARRALELNAAAVICVHNHPSSSLTPSRADEALTQTLKSALALIDVRLLDHFIVGGSQARSMAEMGLV